MSQGPLCPNLTKKFQKEVSQIANGNLSRIILLGGLSVNLNHLKRCKSGRRYKTVKGCKSAIRLKKAKEEARTQDNKGYNSARVQEHKKL